MASTESDLTKLLVVRYPSLIYSLLVLPRCTITPNASSVDTRPSVVLADNHKQVLEIVTRLLASDFNVVGTVEDGRHALDLSLRLDPDVVVLDIRMPELDGFQTLQQLRRAGSRAKVVLLTMYESDAYVAAAITSGAQGYVLKSDIYSDLISAIDHALAGRLFVPSLASLSAAPGGHAVQFHTNDEHYLDDVSRFIGGILRSGELMVVVGTEETRKGIARRLKERGIDPDTLAAQGQYKGMDAAESLANFMRDGRPDANLLAGITAELDRMRISACGPQARLTVFGEMSAVLCRDGNFEAAAELERTWDEMTRHLPLFTVCSYACELFQDAKSHESFPKVCAAHHTVTHSLQRLA